LLLPFKAISGTYCSQQVQRCGTEWFGKAEV
jgi:hypothetical protein